MIKNALLTVLLTGAVLITGCGNEEATNTDTKENETASTKSQKVDNFKPLISDPIEDDMIKAQLTGYELRKDEIVGEILYLTVEFENLSDETLTITSDQASIDDVMLSEFHNNTLEEIPSGKKAKFKVEIYDVDDSVSEDIPSIENNVEFNLEIYNEDNSFDKDYMLSGSVK